LPLYTMQLFDRVIVSGSFETLAYLTVIALFTLAVLAAFDVLRARLLATLGSWAEARLAAEVFNGVVAAALRGGSYQTEALRDLRSLRSFLTAGGITPLLDAIWVPLFIGATYLLHPLLGEIALGAAVVLLALAGVGELVNRRSTTATSALTAEADRDALAVARSAEAITAMGMADAIVRRWFAKSARAAGLSYRASLRVGALSALSKFLRLAVQLALMAAGAFLVLRHELTGGAMIAASIIMGRALAPIEQTIGGLRQMMGARLAYRHLKRHLAASGEEGEGAMALPAPMGAVTVEGLNFVPPGQTKPALQGVSLSLQPGEMLAVIGPAAAGKSTLARLLVGLQRPTSGTVRLDGAEVSTWPKSELGRYVGYLPQSLTLLPGTVGENIARFSEGGPADVVAAARLARIHDMVLRLPRGYDTAVGEIDATLSGGQRQRIGLARSLYGAPRFVVLDEPNSNLDGEAEASLAQTLQELRAQGCSAVVVTHRLGLVTLADKVLALRDGAVELYGARQIFLDRLAPRPVATLPRAVAKEG
ncbi:MAG TPA: type I secretion system permease/ATPase, partial [Kiloniellales bacterium]|nr:type I secretion system permease/ATPase [Kiloniellales bacterium]